MYIRSFHFYHIVEEDDMDFLNWIPFVAFQNLLQSQWLIWQAFYLLTTHPECLRKVTCKQNHDPTRVQQSILIPVSWWSILSKQTSFENGCLLWSLKNNHQSVGFRRRERTLEIVGGWVKMEMILQCLSALSWRSLLVSAYVINNIITSVQLDSANGTSEAHSI